MQWKTAPPILGNVLIGKDLNTPIQTPKIMTTKIATKNGAPSIRVRSNPSLNTHTGTSTITNCSTTSTSTTYYNTAITGGSDIYVDPRLEMIKDVTLEDIYTAIQTGLLDIQLGDYVHVSPGATLTLPDGSVIKVQHNGNFTIKDDNAKVTYKGNRNREFNPFINASDLLEEFIKDLGKVGVKQNQVLNVPVEGFINWLIHKAAEQDGDQPPQDIKLLENERHPKCKHCGKFISKDLPAPFCNGDHYQQYIEREKNNGI